MSDKTKAAVSGTSQCAGSATKFCGECLHFEHEDMDGIGLCAEYVSWRLCENDACGLFKPNVTGDLPGKGE